MSKEKNNIKIDLPKGWKSFKLGEIAEFVGGSQPPKDEFSYVAKEGFIRLIQIRDYKSNDNIVYVNKKSARRFCGEEDIMIGRYGPPVFQILRGLKGAYNVALMKAIPNETLLSKEYFFRYLKNPTIQSYIIGLSQRSAGQSGVNKEALENYETAIPPLPEQQRIVQQLDALFQRINKAIQLSKENLEHCRHLLPAALNEVFGEAEEKGWKVLTLQEMLDENIITSHLDGNHGSYYPRSEEFVASGVPYISANCIKDGKIDFSKSKYLTIERSSQLKKGVAINNDVLFAHNATVGPVAILETDESKVILSTSLTYYRCNPKEIYFKYLYFYLQSETFTSQYKAVMGQATRNQVPITKQREFTHIIPTIEEQKKIADKLITLELKQQQLQRHYTKQLQQLQQLKASLLDGAFKGEL